MNVGIVIYHAWLKVSLVETKVEPNIW